MTNIHEGDLDILLVEDDPSIGGFLQAAMDREPGYRLHWATTLKDAWKAWEKRQVQEGGIGGSVSRGTEKQNTAPRTATRLRTQMRPPCSSIIWRPLNGPTGW